MKIGRNEPCPCGSGRKFKKCCIHKDSTQARATGGLDPAQMQARIQEARRAHEAQENVRRQQQGHGKPIMSVEISGHRVVTVGNRFYRNKNWVVFPDFLVSFLKEMLGPKWGQREQAKGQHPVFRWLKKFKRHNDALARTASGRLLSGELTGPHACVLHLAYALYQVAHNDEIPKRLLRRLREPSTFLPAYYEALVGAALATAGFQISSAETKASSKPMPEFRATSKVSGNVYEVEAKRKDRWKSATEDVAGPEFLQELESYIRDQMHAASKKKLTNPIYWFELSIPTIHDETAWRAIATKVKGVISEAQQTMTVDGQPIPPAFIAITNHTFLASEDAADAPFFGCVESIRIDDYPFGRPLEIEAALEGYDKYRDILWMMNAWKIARNLPVTFDGSPPELLTRDGEPRNTIRIGQVVLVPDETGQNVEARVEDIASMGSTAMAIVHSPATGKRWTVSIPLTEGEAQAAAHFTDAVFGKADASHPLRHEDPFDLYDRLLGVYRGMTPDQIGKALDASDHLRQFKSLPLENARIRLAREYTKSMWTQGTEIRAG